MASQRARVMLIFGVIAALVGAGAYYFLAIYQPKQRLSAARAAVEAWENRWASARDCLLGPGPASSRISEALAVREMATSAAGWDKALCTKLLGALSRDPTQTGMAEVEAAWNQVGAAAAAAAKAFGMHVSGVPVKGVDALPAALDGLEAARARLRAAVKLPAAEQPGKPLPTAQVIPINDGDEALTDLQIDALPSAHGLVAFGKTATHEVQVTLTTGGAPWVGRVGAGAMRAVPDGSWGVVAGDGEVHAGGMDREGGIASPITIPLPGAHTVTVAAAAGTLAAGVFVYGGDSLLAIAHAHAQGLTADSPMRSIATGDATTDADGRIALVWTTHDREHHARILRPGGDDPQIELTEVVSPGGGDTPAARMARPAMSSAPCLTGDRGWVQFGSVLVGFGGPNPPVRLEAEGHLIGCTADAALLRSNEGYAICSQECRTAELSGAPDDASITVVGGKLVALAEHGGVLAVWREGQQAPAYYGLPQPAHPVPAREWAAMALCDGKTIDIVARGGTTFAVIRIPAS